MSKERKQPHCIALFSGGLDSALAVLLMLRQNIKVTALTFLTQFGCDIGDKSSCGSNPYPAAEKFGFDVKLMHLGDKFIEIVKNPKYGHGKNMNPCTDCRILMLSEAKELMEMINADFIITGEVMGQRPMSQVKNKINLVAKQSELVGKLLRPLSAKLLNPTEPELNGLVNRELLEGISGRSRKRQMEMAKEFGLEDYPSPASGCLLTDEPYSNKLRDLFAHTEHTTSDDLSLLKIGRHFRLDSNTKIIVGRNEQENESIIHIKKAQYPTLEVLEHGSPVTILIGDATEENILKAAQITARYSSVKNLPNVKVSLLNSDNETAKKSFDVSPASDKLINEIRI